MDDATETDVWTLQALKQHFEQRFNDRDRAMAKADKVLNRRLAGMNKFRRQIDHERSQFATVTKHDQLDERIDELRRTYVSSERFDGFIARVDARATGYERWQNKLVGALALVGLVFPIVSALIVYWATHA